MNVETSSGVRITVETKYLAPMSNPLLKIFFFRYEVSIENLNEFPIQLLRRHWLVNDELGVMREVDGEGVVGKMPILEPGAKYQYTSVADIRTVHGTMEGSYLFMRMEDHQQFRARIPQFQLRVPFNLN